MYVTQQPKPKRQRTGVGASGAGARGTGASGAGGQRTGASGAGGGEAREQDVAVAGGVVDARHT